MVREAVVLRARAAESSLFKELMGCTYAALQSFQHTYLARIFGC